MDESWKNNHVISSPRNTACRLEYNNILFDQAGNIYLIDFDRCVQRPYSQAWAQVGLNRLKRSLEKQKQNNSNTCYQQSDFESLMQGYQD